MTIRPVLGLAVALALAGCAQVDRGSSDGQSGGGLAPFLSCMRQVAYDYEPAETPAALAAEADAVVTGTIVAVERGQSYAPAPESPPLVATSVLEVKVDQVIAGDEAVVADGSVYVELNPFDHESCVATVPTADGVFFLDDITSEPYWDTIVDEGAGRPPDARLTATFVQGFLIEDANGRLVSVKEPLDQMRPPWRELDSVEEVVAQLD